MQFATIYPGWYPTRTAHLHLKVHLDMKTVFTGQLFFASSNDLYTQFDYAEDPDAVVIDLTDSHVWDASTVASLDAITTKYARNGKTVEIVGLNVSSAERHERLSGSLPSH